MRISNCTNSTKNSVKPEEFKQRTKALAVRIIKLVDSLPNSRSTNVSANQLMRSGTSVGANYRAVRRAKSRADFISKLGTVEEEGDETLYWLELLVESGKMKAAQLSSLMKEADEILAMVCASLNTARSRKESAIRNPQSAIA